MTKLRFAQWYRFVQPENIMWTIALSMVSNFFVEVVKSLDLGHVWVWCSSSCLPSAVRGGAIGQTTTISWTVRLRYATSIEKLTNCMIC
jgi:hypothetical protein